MEFATFGSAVAWLLVTVSETVVKTGVGEAVKSAYRALADRVTGRSGGTAGAPGSGEVTPVEPVAVAARIDGLPATERDDIGALALELVEALADQERRGPVGLDVKRLNAARVILGDITALEGVGARFGPIETQGDFSTGTITVGSSAGKPRG